MEREGFINSKIYRKKNQSDRTLPRCNAMTSPFAKNVPKRQSKTCADAAEVSWYEIVDSASLEFKGAGAVDGRNRSVGLLHPVYQPLDFTVTAERVPPQVSE